MEYIDFKKLIDALTAKPKETEWLEFKHNFHSKEEIGERISALSNSSYLCNMPLQSLESAALQSWQFINSANTK